VRWSRAAAKSTGEVSTVAPHRAYGRRVTRGPLLCVTSINQQEVQPMSGLNKLMGRGIIPPVVHGVLDYPLATVLIVLPLVLSFDDAAAKWIAFAFGIGAAVLAVGTAWQTGIVLPFIVGFSEHTIRMRDRPGGLVRDRHPRPRRSRARSALHPPGRARTGLARSGRRRESGLATRFPTALGTVAHDFRCRGEGAGVGAAVSRRAGSSQSASRAVKSTPTSTASGSGSSNRGQVRGCASSRVRGHREASPGVS
jgi:hypothetical protein